MRKDLLDYFIANSDTAEVVYIDDIFGKYKVIIPSFSISLDAFSVRFIGTEDEIVERIAKAPSLELAMLFTQPIITPMVEIALERKKEELRDKKRSDIQVELETACKASKLTVASVLRFIRTNYGIDIENDYEGIKRYYKQAIQKLTALPF